MSTVSMFFQMEAVPAEITGDILLVTQRIANLRFVFLAKEVFPAKMNIDHVDMQHLIQKILQSPPATSSQIYQLVHIFQNILISHCTDETEEWTRSQKLAVKIYASPSDVIYSVFDVMMVLSNFKTATHTYKLLN